MTYDVILIPDPQQFLTMGSIISSQHQQLPPPVAPSDSVGSCPVRSSSRDGCPVKHEKLPEYNVYSQPIDPSNQMPYNPNQLPAPGQSKALSTERVASTIPKVGAFYMTWIHQHRFATDLGVSLLSFRFLPFLFDSATFLPLPLGRFQFRR
jgi:Cytochrome c/c1 heme lyase